MDNDITWSITQENIDIEGADDIEYKLAHLIINAEIFCNNGWWDKSLPEGAVTLHVNCNDIFGWGCADSEDILHDEIHELYAMWRKDPGWGVAVWCIKKRQCWPQDPVKDAIAKAGVWNLKEILDK